MKPAVVFADPEERLVAHLKAAWSFRSEEFKPVKVSTKYPPDSLVDDETWIQVDHEATNSDDYPVAERAQVRVTCHAARGRRSNVKAMASVTQALTATHPGDDDVAGVFLAGGRSGVAVDPDTENLMVWFLARVVLKAQPLAP